MKNEAKIPLNQIFFSFPIINKQKIEELIQLDSSYQLYFKLLDIFKSEFLEKQLLLKEKMNDQDFNELTEVAHRLRSTCYNVGAYRMAEMLKKIELDFLDIEELDVKNSEIEAIVDSLDVEFNNTLSEIQTYLAEVKLCPKN